MQAYTDMPTESLMDLLARETEKFTLLMTTDKFSPEFEQCKEAVSQLQQLIETRKSATFSQSTPVFTEPGTT